ncbi:MAG TPA: hypothetical protein VHN13_05500 [Candidatus Tectomicrobia bacterium]|nr:hypothetical protein [Candidatus Tectomicrobia bacterium]
MSRWYVSMIVQMVTALAVILPRAVPAAEFACAEGDVTCLINAITAANANGEANTITLAAGTYTLTAVNNTTVDGPNGLPSITSPLTITGANIQDSMQNSISNSFNFTSSGVGNITIGQNTGTVTGVGNLNAPTIIEQSLGAPDFGLVHIAETGTVVLDGLTLRGGAGAIANHGTLTLANSVLAGNVHGLGGGIHNTSTMTIVNSALSTGDGISNAGDMAFTNCTVTSDISNDGDMAFTNCTVSGSGSMSNAGVVTVQNTILAVGISDCSGPFISLGNNLIIGATGCHILGDEAQPTENLR